MGGPHKTSQATETKPFRRDTDVSSAVRREAGWLIVCHRNGAKTVALPHGRGVIVGRAPPADVVIDDVSLSRAHARLTLDDREVSVEDLGSTNGTWLGGQRIQHATIRPGDELALGAVSAMFHVQAATSSLRLGLEGHDRFVSLLEAEVLRARHFGRSLAVLMVKRARHDEGAHLGHWAPRIQARLRPVDRPAVYSSKVLELFAPEIDEEQALSLARAVVEPHAGAPPLWCGVALFPACASTADRLIEAAREALKGASTDTPVCIADAQGARTFVPAADTDTDDAIVHDSAVMRETMDMARRLARGVIPVLIQGETGCGKEVVARSIHRSGPRRDRPMVVVNCAALSSQLIESTLFGHEKGSFTGALQRQIGVFEAASGSTVFLDEIGELPPDAQAKLLRVLEQKTITRVGATKEIQVDVRILAATHRDLEAMAAEGEFRADLLYRLNALTLAIPPLRERRNDIAPLARRFLELANHANGTSVDALEPEALEALERYGWPGNARELRNAMERAVVVAEGTSIALDDLPACVRELHAPPSTPLNEPPSATTTATCGPDEDYRACMERLEAEVLLGALCDAGWNQSVAARRLGMPRRTLVRKIALHRLRRAP